MMQTRWADSLVLFILAALSIWDGLRIITTKQEIVGAMGAGGWLVLIGSLLAIATGVHSYRQFKSKSHEERDQAEGENAPVLPVVIVVAMVMAFVFFLPRWGYMICTALFFVIYLSYFGRYNPIAIALGTAAFAIGSAYLWAEVGLTIPQGIVPWP